MTITERAESVESVERETAFAPRQRRGVVLVIDDHSLITQALMHALRGEDLDVVVCSSPDADEVVALARRHRPRLALVDLQFGGIAMEGLTLIGPLADVGTPSLVLTGVGDRAVLGMCLEAGAVGVASKAESFDSLLGQIDAALREEPVNTVVHREDLLQAARERRAEEEERRAPFRTLSRRECEVLDHLSAGLTADAIAARMFVSLPTVRTQIQAILRKLQVNSQLAAVAIARECGWSLEGSAS